MLISRYFTLLPFVCSDRSQGRLALVPSPAAVAFCLLLIRLCKSESDLKELGVCVWVDGLWWGTVTGGWARFKSLSQLVLPSSLALQINYQRRLQS